MTEPKPLSRIMAAMDYEAEPAARGLGFRGLQYDSRKVQSGELFFCIEGLNFDGHDFAGDAVRAGAAALVVQRRLPDPGAPQVLVPDSRLALALAAAEFYDRPSEKLALTGVTGTNGKTSVAFLIDGVRRSLGRTTGLMGTVVNRIADREVPVVHTTPESLDLQRLLAQMVEARCDSAVMEVSSHAVVMGRIKAARFAAGVFTNISQDHLDFHKTFDYYLAAKARFFSESLTRGCLAVVNGDDPAAERIIQNCPARVLRYGVGDECDVRARNVNLSFMGAEFDLVWEGESSRVKLRLLGEFNVMNALAAAAAVLGEGAALEDVARGLQNCPPVPGRFETVHTADLGFVVIVDYAHTPDGIEKALDSARLITPGRLIIVFGCGGDRDRTKRPIMGRLAARGSDFVIVTSDNPRTEAPESIIEEILEGVREVEGAPARSLVEVDRREAIGKAVMAARQGDTVLIAGKGHEDYQIFRDRTIHFDDRETAVEFIRERQFGTDQD